MHDSLLICRFVEEKSEAAFTEIVRRHARLVYNTCFRETRDTCLPRTRLRRSLSFPDTSECFSYTPCKSPT